MKACFHGRWRRMAASLLALAAVSATRDPSAWKAVAERILNDLTK